MVNFTIDNLALSLPALIYIISFLELILDLSSKQIDFGILTIICGIVVGVGAIGFIFVILKPILG